MAQQCVRVSAHNVLRLSRRRLLLLYRVLSDWLEVKLGGGEGSRVKEKQVDGTLQTLCVTNALQEVGEREHKVHLSIKVGSILGSV